MTATFDLKKNWWIPSALLISAIVFTYRDTIPALYNQWISSEDFSHGLLILPISLYLVWKKRSELERISISTDRRALILMVFAVGIYIVGELGAELFTTRVSMLVFAIGSVWLLFGRKVLKTLRFPLLFLFLMLPLPGFIYRNMTFPLQIISSKLSVDLLYILDITAYREGNVIDMGFTRFQVVEACNGLRFIMPLFTVGVLFAFTERKVLWKRLVLIASTIPLAIGANVVRIAGTGVVSLFWGAKAAEGFFHSFSGWAVFIICFASFVGIYYLLNHMPGKVKTKTASDHSGRTDKKGGMRASLFPILLALVLILSTSGFISLLGRVPPVPLKKSLNEFPLVIGDWIGEMDSMNAKMWEQVGGQSYVMVNYLGKDDRTIGFYTAYYEYQRKAGDFIHSPKLCLPGAGWYIQKSKVRKLNLQQAVNGVGNTLKFNEIVVVKNDAKQLVYYWYQGRDRNFTNEYTAKFFLVLDGMFRRRTDGALVRLVMPICESNTVEDTRETLDTFALMVTKELSDHFP
jgi:exosortase D (VPLPA-CTERM-specific)